MGYRPFVTCPDGTCCFLGWVVKTDQDRQEVLNRVGAYVRNQLGTQAQTIPPERQRDFAAKVEFFRVAFG